MLIITTLKNFIKGNDAMSKSAISMVLSLVLLSPVSSFAQEPLLFNGLKFGMNADEITKIAGGNTEHGCASAIQNDISYFLHKGNKPWVYAGIDTWSAHCVEDARKSYRVPGVSGLVQLKAMVKGPNNDYAKQLRKKTYSVEELANMFSKEFGTFTFESKVIKDIKGKDVTKKSAKATHKDAVITIFDLINTKPGEDFIFVKIVSLDYLTKEQAMKK